MALVTDLYSASVLDLETVGCFLELQETRLPPRNIAYPPVLRQSSELPAQSASENALSKYEPDFVIQRPSLDVSLKYLRIRLTAIQ